MKKGFAKLIALLMVACFAAAPLTSCKDDKTDEERLEEALEKLD